MKEQMILHLIKRICHFENSNYLDGNVCLAGHNTNEILENYILLEVGDRINYASFLGTKTYAITDMKEIHETD